MSNLNLYFFGHRLHKNDIFIPSENVVTSHTGLQTHLYRFVVVEESFGRFPFRI
jgi:hypothetical protein